MDSARITQLRPSRRFDLADFVSRRALGILLLGGVLFLCLLPMALVKGNFHYETSGTLLIAREVPQIVGSGDEFNIVNYFHDYARTQVERIQSPANLEAALLLLPEKERQRFKPDGTPVSSAIIRLQRGLLVQQIPNTHVLSVKLTRDAPDGMAEMVNAVMDSYIARLRHESESKDSRRLDYLNQEREALAREIATAEADVEKIIRRTKISPQLEQNNVALQRALSLQDASLRAAIERTAADNALAAARAERDRLRKVPNKVLADEMVANDQSLWRTTSWTYEKLQELRASIDGISKTNPDRQYIEKRMDAMQEYERKQRQTINDLANRIVNEKRDYELTSRLISAETAARAKEETAEELGKRYEDAVQALETTSQLMMQGRNLLEAIENNKRKLFEMDSRIRDLVIEAKAPLRVSIESYAVRPDSPAGSNQKKLITLCFVLAMGFFAAVFFLYDFTDARIRSAQTVADALGHPPAWPISFYPPAAGDFARLSRDAPDTTPAKAIRSLAVRINKERGLHAAQTAMLTGICPESGVSALALNLSHAMTYFCPRVLLLVFGTGAGGPEDAESEGWDAWLRSNRTHDPERNTDTLALAPIMASEESSRRMPEFMARLRAEYDFILVDAPPLLASDTTEMLAVLSDIVVVVVQGDRTLYPDFIRGMDILLRLEVPAVAVALNWGGRQIVSRFDSSLERIPWPGLREQARIALAWLRRALYRVNMGSHSDLALKNGKPPA